MLPMAGWLKPTPATPFGVRALLPTATASRWPPFTSWLLVLLVAAKPLSDAFYEVEVVKYLYMLLLGGGALLARYGHAFDGTPADPRNRYLLLYTLAIVAYFYFLMGEALTQGGSLSAIFKIVSPFVFFVLVVLADDRWVMYALVIAAVLTIVVNAALLPFGIGWVQWGGVHTFKGFYFFKTDLAYALVFSVLVLAFFARNRLNLWLGGLILLAAVQVVLSNSRLNYATLVCVVGFIAFKQGISLRFLLRLGVLLGAFGLIVALVVLPEHMLGFDTTNVRAFSQGRSDLWASLWAGIRGFSLQEWLFGLGYFGDHKLVAQYGAGSQVEHNAHNEVLHLVSTQGLIGLCAYVGLWFGMYRMCRPTNAPAWARGTLATAGLLFVLQGMTTVMSSFATKTWPLVMAFLAVRCLGRGWQDAPRPAPC
jgi:hypothetical protein